MFIDYSPILLNIHSHIKHFFHSIRLNLTLLKSTQVNQSRPRDLVGTFSKRVVHVYDNHLDFQEIFRSFMSLVTKCYLR